MASFVALHSRLLFGHLHLTALTKEIEFGPLQAAAVDFTNMGSGGFAEFRPGRKSGAFKLGLLQDRATGVLEDQITLATIGNQWPITVIPNVDGADSVGAPCYLSRGIIASYAAGSATVGEAERGDITGKFDAAFPRGLVAHPLAARTTTGTGTAVAQTGPTSTQRLYAAVHVTAYSGLTNATVRLESDDGAGFASATTRLTFTTATGTTSEFTSVAGGFNTETHLRAAWTLTGTGSVTFAVAFAVL